MSGYDDLLATAGVDHEQFVADMKKLEMMHQMAQSFHMSYLQRCFDLDIPAHVAMLCMYQIARFQVKANMAEGGITGRDVNGSKVLMGMLRDLHHPDGNYPRMLMDKDGTFRRDGTHGLKP